jgi:hypothetical protein
MRVIRIREFPRQYKLFRNPVFIVDGPLSNVLSVILSIKKKLSKRKCAGFAHKESKIFNTKLTLTFNK